jgi:hypothetical protein
MIFKTANASELQSLVRRILFLAYNASNCFGMGVLQQRSGATEEQVFNNAANMGDYPGGNAMRHAPPGDINADYVFGRMMKLSIRYDENNLTLDVSNGTPRPDYQSWCRTYKTYEDLVLAAAKELGISVVKQ